MTGLWYACTTSLIFLGVVSVTREQAMDSVVRLLEVCDLRQLRLIWQYGLHLLRG